jgi:hypothetical protein
VACDLNLAVLALSTALALISLGGGFYEFLVVDPFWPRRPDLIQPERGGISRRRFWIPAHVTFELLLIGSLVANWSHDAVRNASARCAWQSRGHAHLVGCRVHSEGTRLRAR